MRPDAQFYEFDDYLLRYDFGYTLTAVTNSVTDIVADGSFFIIIGDHQPRMPIIEAGSPATAR